MAGKTGGLSIGVLVISGLALWALTQQPAKAVQPPAVPPPPPKQPIVEQPRLSLPDWQAMIPEQLAALPVNTKKDIPIGDTTYNPAINPTLIGDTGFTVWGTTEYGSTVVSKNDPSTYAAWEWL